MEWLSGRDLKKEHSDLWVIVRLDLLEEDQIYWPKLVKFR